MREEKKIGWGLNGKRVGGRRDRLGADPTVLANVPKIKIYAFFFF